MALRGSALGRRRSTQTLAHKSREKAALMAQDAIPEGYQIYEDRLTPAGISFRKDQATAFARRADGWLELEPEPGNKHDKNAIKVIGCAKGWFRIKRRFVGYVPKEVSRRIVSRGFLSSVRPRLIHTYIGRDGFVDILFQILGPKGRKKEYESG